MRVKACNRGSKDSVGGILYLESKLNLPTYKLGYALALIMKILNQACNPSLKEQFLLKSTMHLMTGPES